MLLFNILTPRLQDFLKLMLGPHHSLSQILQGFIMKLLRQITTKLSMDIGHLLKVQPFQTSSANTDAANKEYVDNVVVGGSPNANYTTRGIVLIATKAQAATNVQTGTTGAFLAIPSAMSTATGATGTTVAVISQPNGKIASSFIDQTENYTWTGTSIFNGITQINGTTTIAGLINPITPGANKLAQYNSSGQYAAQDGSLIKNISKLLHTETSDVSTSGSTELTVTTFSVPGGTLGTNQAIRVKSYLSIGLSALTFDITVKLKYGGSTLVTETFHGGIGNGSAFNGFIEGVVIASGATNTQYAVLGGIVSNGPGTSSNQVGGGLSGSGTGSIDSTTNQNIVLTITANTGSATAFGATIELV